ncbi:MAG: hypothetical protein A2X84_11825 [Desulfuromonadaceae bacterium GWC2_58_13]|nr:MAG: hypothetical protein A2X84_11825 [Desulfuromonadaceae bacterium GWC2_58_13]
MRRLTLIRHAKSSWKDKSLSDFERPLNKRGRQNAAEMGKRLAERHFQPDMMITSPARRALATSWIIAGEVDWPVERLILEPRFYEADVATLTKVIRNLDDRWRHVVLLGHNPAFTDLANELAGTAIENIPTCGILELALEIERWSQTEPKSARVTDFDYPKKD